MKINLKKKEDQDIVRDIVRATVKNYNFEELYSVKESSNEKEEVEIKTIKRGYFKGKDGHLGVFCKFVDFKLLGDSVNKALTNRFEVDKIYEGEKHLLCLANSKLFSYNIEYYNQIQTIIDEIDYELPSSSTKLKIGYDSKSHFHILIIETDFIDFSVAGLKSDNQEEVERVILSKKLASSQPFFEFKAPIYFEWNKLKGDKDSQFERICELLLQKENNIKSIIPIGKTRASDRGRDFEVIEENKGFNTTKKIKWLVQCKFSENSISPKHLAGWTDRVIEHKYDGYWLMTNNDLTPSLFDQFKDVETNEKYSIDVRFWQRSDFHIKLNVNSELFTKGDIFDLK